MSVKLRNLFLLTLGTLAHAACTGFLLRLYLTYAMKVEHGELSPTFLGTLFQYLKSLFLMPLLLPVLRWDSATKPLILVFLLLNSFIWVWGCWWLWHRLLQRRKRNV